MRSIRFALLIGAAAVAIALLAVFDIIPAQAAHYVPLAVVPFIVPRLRPCREQAQ